MQGISLTGSLLLAVFIMVAMTMPAQVFAGSAQKPVVSSGKRKLLLFAKSPADWSIVKNGGTGKLVYHPVKGAFTLNVAGLPPHAAYALIRYADDPPKAEILAKGSSDSRGRLELSGVWKNWTKKFWLVTGEDLDGRVGSVGRFIAWRPDRYLFEEKQLGIPCNCPEPEEP